MIHINIEPQRLYEGCILAAIAHAVTVGEYPELDYEHSWDGRNYCTNNSEGCRAVITFHNKYIVAVFQDIAKIERSTEALDYFDGAQKDIMELAKAEAFQYVLDTVDGKTKPVITAAFWGTWDQLSSSQPFPVIYGNGGYIIENQLLEYQKALGNWKDYYDFHDGQLDLIHSLFQRKLQYGLQKQIELSKEDARSFYGEISFCKESLQELNIIL